MQVRCTLQQTFEHMLPNISRRSGAHVCCKEYGILQNTYSDVVERKREVNQSRDEAGEIKK